ncbi:hypothetical protein AKO1_001756 [Acrasis kona]|uniref:Uncharacterized protein n=1 Tax=Acrasis kona TaxID=1008807 RepID=A0AAW2Z9J7_9EUKA
MKCLAVGTKEYVDEKSAKYQEYTNNIQKVQSLLDRYLIDIELQVKDIELEHHNLFLNAEYDSQPTSSYLFSTFLSGLSSNGRLCGLSSRLREKERILSHRSEVVKVKNAILEHKTELKRMLQEHASFLTKVKEYKQTAEGFTILLAALQQHKVDVDAFDSYKINSEDENTQVTRELMIRTIYIRSREKFVTGMYDEYKQRWVETFRTDALKLTFKTTQLLDALFVEFVFSKWLYLNKLN